MPFLNRIEEGFGLIAQFGKRGVHEVSLKQFMYSELYTNARQMYRAMYIRQCAICAESRLR